MPEKKRRKPSCSLERGLTCYPNHRIHQMVIADAFNEYISNSEKISTILTSHYKSLSEEKQKKLILCFESLTVDQIKSKKGFISKHD